MTVTTCSTLPSWALVSCGMEARSGDRRSQPAEKREGIHVDGDGAVGGSPGAGCLRVENLVSDGKHAEGREEAAQRLEVRSVGERKAIARQG